MDVQYIFKGILVGLMVSIPLGPIGVLVIQKTIQKGRLSGFVSGLGAAVADMFYASVAAFGLGIVINFVKTQEFYLQLIGGIFLVYVGMRIFFTNSVKHIRSIYKTKKKNMLGDFLSIFFLTISNPIAVFVFVAIFAGTSILDPVQFQSSLKTELFLIFGILLGASLWWYVLSSLINIFRHKFRLRQLFWINKISGMLIALMGFVVFITCFDPIRSFFN